MTWLEHLRSQGASEDDIKILDTPLARKAFDAQQSAIATAAADAEAARTKLTNYDKWYNEQALPAYNDMAKKKTLAEGAEARARAVIRAAAESDEGLKDIAKSLGYEVDDTPPNRNNPPRNDAPPIDTSKFLTADQLPPLFEQVGENLAALEDMVMEHQILFGNDATKRLRVSELRRRAVSEKRPIHEIWEREYNVPAVRAAAEKKARDDHEAAIRTDERNKANTEWASKYGNPDTRPAAPSHSPFAPRADRGREKQPWEIGTEGESGSGDRVRRATERALRPN